ncbi:glycosyl hydrolase [Aquisphaera insulae]|uniref:glycosyl hydrolase n=1 Tax=Aquisphaera insulae TaxID=2712864 RepID=UPI0013ED2267|nr:glycosyl hydrolase [Aquisphaera insulae]
MRTTGAWAIAGILILLDFTVAASEPANPKANPQARAVLAYFQSLEGRRDRRLVSGQFDGFGPGASLRACTAAHEKTRRWPAMIGLDYADFSPRGIATKHVNRIAIEYARAGGLVTISAHVPNPANPKGGGLRDRGVDLRPLLQPGATHDRWMSELDLLADGLAELQDAGVVVLWRPFHEMNGGWFWWGAKPPETFLPVWKHMFDHFTKVRGLNNLLWVYGPNHGSRTAEYYAGDDYVDLVGLDAYTDLIDPSHIRGYPEVARLPKPFGFTEFGPHGPEKPPGDYDYTRFRDGIEASFPRTVFFLSWNEKWGLGSNVKTREFLEHPWVLNREDLPAGLGLRP